MVEETLKQGIERSLKDLGFSVSKIHLEHPGDLSHGDYSTNVAMTLVKGSGKNPKELSEEIVKTLPAIGGVEKIEIAGPGFINFHLSKDFFVKEINEILEKGGTWGSNTLHEGRRIMVEYTDPNPFKEFHIGHLVPNALGEAIARLIEYSGAEVKRANYQGDVGMHVAKALWGLMQRDHKELDAKILGEAYAHGATAYEEQEDAKKEIDAINKKIYERSDESINALYDSGRKVSLEHFETLYKTLGTTFDFYFFESETGSIGKELVEEGLEEGIFEKSDNAVVYRGEQDNLHTRVFINSEGLPTYEAKDLGLIAYKEEKFPFDLSITITGNEQKEYFRVVRAALARIRPELAERLHVITNGFLRLSSGKMSSRTGDVITAASLLDDVKKIVHEKIDDKEIAEQIAVGAIKYSILKQASGKDIVFDHEKSLSFEGDSGPYLQYTHTRAQSVLQKAEKEGVTQSTAVTPEEVGDVERLLYRFPEVVIRAVEEYEPHYVTTYLTELAGAFNTYYAKEKILDGSEAAAYKVALTQAVATTMKNGLHLLGIETPPRM